MSLQNDYTSKEFSRTYSLWKLNAHWWSFYKCTSMKCCYNFHRRWHQLLNRPFHSSAHDCIDLSLTTWSLIQTLWDGTIWTKWYVLPYLTKPFDTQLHWGSDHCGLMYLSWRHLDLSVHRWGMSVWFTCNHINWPSAGIQLLPAVHQFCTMSYQTVAFDLIPPAGTQQRVQYCFLLLCCSDWKLWQHCWEYKWSHYNYWCLDGGIHQHNVHII